MKELFLVAKGELEPKDEGQRAYRELVFNRFYDAISTTFPLFSSFVGEEALSKLISLFLREKHSSPLLLNLLGEFVEFFRKAGEHLKSDKPFLEELLIYEWTEVELFNASDSTEEKVYRLSPSARLLTFEYPVHRAEELNKEEIVSKRDRYYLLLYRDPETYEVNSVELTRPVFEFLRLLEGSTPKEAIRKVDWGVDVNEVEGYILRFVEELKKKGVLSGP